MSIKKNTLYTFLTQFPNLLLGVLAGIFITRILGPEGKGIYTIFQTNIQLLALVIGFNIHESITFFISKKELPTPTVIGLSFYAILFAFMSAFLVFIFQGFFSSIDLLFPKNLNAFFYIAYLIISFLATIVTSNFLGIFQGFKFFNLVNITSLLSSVLSGISYSVLFILHTYYTLQVDIELIFLTSVSIQFVSIIVMFFMYIKYIKVIPEFNISINNVVKPILKYSGLGYTSIFINFFNYRLDLWVITYYTGFVQLGLYSLAVNISQMLWMVSTPIAKVLLPYLTSYDREEKIAKLQLYARLNATLLIFLGIMAAFIGPFIIPIVYGYEFEGSVYPFQILLIGVIFSGFMKPFATLVAAENKIHLNLNATILGLVFTVLLDFTLIPSLGIIGASIATVIVYIIIFCVVFYHCLFTIRIPFKNYFFLTRKDILYFFS